MSETLVTSIPALQPGERLLCGPGPSNVNPEVLEAMGKPMNGHLDPDFWDILVDLTAGLQALWRRADGLSPVLQRLGDLGHGGRAREPHRARRQGDRDPRRVLRGQDRGDGAPGAELVELTAPLGQIVPLELVEETLRPTPTRSSSAVVHAETSTGVRYPVAELGRSCARAAPEALLLVDAVTSLGGEEVSPTEWGVDYAYSCSQKSLGCPPGLSPFSVSPRALERSRDRKAPVSFSFDIDLLEKYWVERPMTYHHTMPILQYYALYEGIRLSLEEGLENRWARHEDAGRYFQQQMRDRGYTFLSDPDHQLWELRRSTCPRAWTARTSRRRSCAASTSRSAAASARPRPRSGALA